MLNRIDKIFSSLDSCGNFATLGTYFAAIIVLRNGIESIISEQKIIGKVFFFCQYPLFYLCGFLLAAIWLSVFTGDGKKASRVSALGAIMILFAPLFDLLLFGKGIPLGYLNFDSLREYLTAALSFGIVIPVKFSLRTVSMGMRLELWLIYLLMFIYVLSRRRCLLRALAAPYLFHISLFLFPGSASFLATSVGKFFTSAFGGIFVGTKYIRPTTILTIMTAILLPLWLWLLDGRYIRALLLAIRPLRLAHYGGMLLAGIWIGSNGSISKILQLNIFDTATLIIGYISMWFFAVFINDHYDIDADRICRSRRPVAVSLISAGEGKIFAYSALVFGLVVLGSVRQAPFMMAAIFIASAYIYSVPPARTKRIPIISTLTLSVASLSAMLIGYSFAHGNIDNFPTPIAIAVIVCITIGFTTKDLKDIEGDRATGTITIPGIIGERYANYVCAIMSGMAIFLIPVIAGTSQEMAILFAAVFAVVSAGYIAFAKHPNERIPLVIYLVYATVYIIFWQQK